MNTKPLILAASIFAACSAFTAANAQSIYADTVIKYSGAAPGDLPFYDAGQEGGGLEPGSFEDVTDGDPLTYITLSKDWYITLGFSQGYAIDGEGADLYIEEVGDDKEKAEIWVSADEGVTFKLLGEADGNNLTSFDFAKIGYSTVNAIKVLSTYGGLTAPGFDLAFVEALHAAPVPEPETWAMLLAGLGLMGGMSRALASRRAK